CHRVPPRPSQGQTLQPVASTRSPGGVPGQLSTSSGTPSPSASAPAGRRGAVDDVVVEEVDVVLGRVVVVVTVVELVVGRVVVVVVGRVVVVVEVVDVVVGRVVVVVVGRVVVVVEVVTVVVGGLVVVVDVVVVVVGETETVSRHDAPATLCAIRALTALPKRRSMFASPPLSRWQ